MLVPLREIRSSCKHVCCAAAFVFVSIFICGSTLSAEPLGQLDADELSCSVVDESILSDEDLAEASVAGEAAAQSIISPRPGIIINLLPLLCFLTYDQIENMCWQSCNVVYPGRGAGPCTLRSGCTAYCKGYVFRFLDIVCPRGAPKKQQKPKSPPPAE